jgi:GT2 family glycosyltransferase
MKDKNSEMKKEPRVAIIILGMNNRKLVKNCLLSLKKNTSYKNYKVIFSDNGSTDGTKELIKKEFSWVDLVENGKNLGFAGGNNSGIKFALKRYKPAYFLLLNNDTIIFQKRWLNNLVEAGEESKKNGIVGCKLIYPDKSIQHIGFDGRTHLYDSGEMKKLDKNLKNKSEKVQEVRYVMGAVFMIKNSLIKKIGSLDSDYFPIYGEEIDYCERAKKNNYKIIYTPFSTVIHLRSQTTDPKKMSKHWFFSKKNSIMLEFSNFGFFEIIYWQLTHLGAIFFSKINGRMTFRKDFPKRILLLFKAYFLNLKRLKKIIHKRKNRDEVLW